MLVLGLLVLGIVLLVAASGAVKILGVLLLIGGLGLGALLVSALMRDRAIAARR